MHKVLRKVQSNAQCCRGTPIGVTKALEMQEKIVASKLFKRERARKKSWENLQISWKAYLFLKSNFPDDADEGEKSMLEAARIIHEIKLGENCLRLNKINFEIEKLNAELAEIKKRLERS